MNYFREKWSNKAVSIIQPSISKIIVHQYDIYDNEIAILDDKQLFKQPNYKDYYYRLEPYLSAERTKKTDIHFGVAVSNVGSNAFDIGIYTNQLLNHLISSFEPPVDLMGTIRANLGFHFQKFHELSKLNHEEFSSELLKYLDNIRLFTEIDDLNKVRKNSGLYLLVLDDYACCYIGQSNDIKKRIQQHWRRTKFNTTGIDMFKALDTTRIFVISSPDNIAQHQTDHAEYTLIHSIDRQYLLNYWGGGGSMEFIHSDSSRMGYGTAPI